MINYGKKTVKVVLFSLLAICGTVLAAQTPKLIHQCIFTQGNWNVDDWTMVKSPRWDHFGKWIQKSDHIINSTPADATEIEKQGKRAGETYSSMLYKHKVKGNVIITSNMGFEYRMAPLIVIAPELGLDSQGRLEYREHWEIVLYDKGVNVWHHYYKDGKPSWKKAAYARFPLDPLKKYQIQVVKNGANLEISVDGHTFAYRDETLPDEFYAGITGCEGINRFYDFKIEQQ